MKANPQRGHVHLRSGLQLVLKSVTFRKSQRVRGLLVLFGALVLAVGAIAQTNSHEQFYSLNELHASAQLALQHPVPPTATSEFEVNLPLDRQYWPFTVGIVGFVLLFGTIAILIWRSKNGRKKRRGPMGS